MITFFNFQNKCISFPYCLFRHWYVAIVSCMCLKVKLLIWCGELCPVTTVQKQTLWLLCSGVHCTRTVSCYCISIAFYFASKMQSKKLCKPSNSTFILVHLQYNFIQFHILFTPFFIAILSSRCTNELFSDIAEISKKLARTNEANTLQIIEPHVQNEKLYNFPCYFFALLQFSTYFPQFFFSSL